MIPMCLDIAHSDADQRKSNPTNLQGLRPYHTITVIAKVCLVGILPYVSAAEPEKVGEFARGFRAVRPTGLINDEMKCQ